MRAHSMDKNNESTPKMIEFVNSVFDKSFNLFIRDKFKINTNELKPSIKKDIKDLFLQEGLEYYEILCNVEKCKNSISNSSSNTKNERKKETNNNSNNINTNNNNNNNGYNSYLHKISINLIDERNGAKMENKLNNNGNNDSNNNNDGINGINRHKGNLNNRNVNRN